MHSRPAVGTSFGGRLSLPFIICWLWWQRSERYAAERGPIDPDCGCMVCKGYSMARLHQLACHEGGAELITLHNIAFQV